jgi:hypothetical protein
VCGVGGDVMAGLGAGATASPHRGGVDAVGAEVELAEEVGARFGGEALSLPAWVMGAGALAGLRDFRYGLRIRGLSVWADVVDAGVVERVAA